MGTESSGGEPDDLPGNVVSVTDLNGDISTLIKQSDELEFDFVIGDVSDNSVSNGTQYFQLVDDGTGIQCLVFAGTQKSIPDFEEGDRVAVKGRLNYYEERGQCSIYVDDVVLMGDSHYHKKIEQLREELEDDGVFADEEKQQLPKYPSRIGIVTSKGSDAEEDAINAIHEKHPDIDLTLCDSRVQGIAAMEDICNGITYLDALKSVDVIIVTRGGGSEQDLHAFNTEGVTRTIARTDTPIVTAIGHENDRPLVDDAADDRAMTPTEIGTVVVPDKAQREQVISEYRVDVQQGYNGIVTRRLEEYRERVTVSYTSYVDGTIEDYKHQTNAAFDRVAAERLMDLRNRVETAYTVLEKEKVHEDETEDLQAQNRLYKIALIALLLLILIMGLVWLFS